MYKKFLQTSVLTLQLIVGSLVLTLVSGTSSNADCACSCSVNGYWQSEGDKTDGNACAATCGMGHGSMCS